MESLCDLFCCSLLVISPSAPSHVRCFFHLFFMFVVRPVSVVSFLPVILLFFLCLLLFLFYFFFMFCCVFLFSYVRNIIFFCSHTLLLPPSSYPHSSLSLSSRLFPSHSPACHYRGRGTLQYTISYSLNWCPGGET